MVITNRFYKPGLSLVDKTIARVILYSGVSLSVALNAVLIYKLTIGY